MVVSREHTDSAAAGASITDALERFRSDFGPIDMRTVPASLDSLASGLGTLIDADLATESVRLQALQVRQQLAAQALSIANQTPQALLTLFREAQHPRR